MPLDDPLALVALNSVRDSKRCTPRTRERLYDLVTSTAVTWGVSLVPAWRIDELGIVGATRQAMREAIAQLEPSPQALLIDALALPALALPQRALAMADQSSVTVAAASILAKVTRDRAMVTLERSLPGYGFARHKGYGTPEHLAALQEFGPCPFHRRSFAPVRQMNLGF